MKRPIPLTRGDFAQVGRGLLMGGADIIPGVSGGTVALILGIYIRLVTAISRFDLALLGYLRQRKWRLAAEHVDLRFLVALGSGILLGVAGLATLMNYLLEHQLMLTLAAFFGLILGSCVLVARSIERWSPRQVLLAVAGAAFAYWLVGQPFLAGNHTLVYLFFCGMVAICAMILPGISGAFILLIMGEYAYVTGIIRDLTHGRLSGTGLLTVAVFSAGCAIGLLAFSKILRWLLAGYHGQTLAVLCGFMIGSLRRIWPFKLGDAVDIKHAQVENVWPQAFDGQVAFAPLLVLAGIALVLALDWLTRRFGPKCAGVFSAEGKPRGSDGRS